MRGADPLTAATAGSMQLRISQSVTRLGVFFINTVTPAESEGSYFNHMVIWNRGIES